MDKKVYSTLIKRMHKFGDSHYVRGRISGIAFSISGFEKETKPNMIGPDGVIISNYFTQDEYVKFVKIVEELYPGLCEFNHIIEKES